MLVTIYFILSLSLCILLLPLCLGKLREGDCEVCIDYLGKLAESAAAEGVSGEDAMKSLLKDKCKTATGKHNRFCYYIGATENAATGIVMEVVRPLASSVPPEKICQKLKKMDEQICDLRYEKEIDVKNTDLTKLRMRELRKILSGWGETCIGCVEKSDYVQRINQLLIQREEL